MSSANLSRFVLVLFLVPPGAAAAEGPAGECSSVRRFSEFVSDLTDTASSDRQGFSCDGIQERLRAHGYAAGRLHDMASDRDPAIKACARSLQRHLSDLARAWERAGADGGVSYFESGLLVGLVGGDRSGICGTEINYSWALRELESLAGALASTEPDAASDADRSAPASGRSTPPRADPAGVPPELPAGPPSPARGAGGSTPTPTPPPDGVSPRTIDHPDPQSALPPPSTETPTILPVDSSLPPATDLGSSPRPDSNSGTADAGLAVATTDTVPAVEGLYVDEAYDMVLQAGLVPTIVVGEATRNVDQWNRVYRQAPPAATKVRSGSSVQLVAYVQDIEGRIVPDLSRKTPAEARGLLAARDLFLDVERVANQLRGDVEGTVMGQYPEAGIEIPRGTAVRIYVYDTYEPPFVAQTGGSGDNDRLGRLEPRAGGPPPGREPGTRGPLTSVHFPAALEAPSGIYRLQPGRKLDGQVFRCDGVCKDGEPSVSYYSSEAPGYILVSIYWWPREKGPNDFYCQQHGVNYTGDDFGDTGYLVWDEESQAWLRVTGCPNCRGESVFESWLPQAAALDLASELLPQVRDATPPKCP